MFSWYCRFLIFILFYPPIALSAQDYLQPIFEASAPPDLLPSGAIEAIHTEYWPFEPEDKAGSEPDLIRDEIPFWWHTAKRITRLSEARYKVQSVSQDGLPLADDVEVVSVKMAGRPPKVRELCRSPGEGEAMSCDSRTLYDEQGRILEVLYRGRHRAAFRYVNEAERLPQYVGVYTDNGYIAAYRNWEGLETVYALREILNPGSRSRTSILDGSYKKDTIALIRVKRVAGGYGYTVLERQAGSGDTLSRSEFTRNIAGQLLMARTTDYLYHYAYRPDGQIDFIKDDITGVVKSFTYDHDGRPLIAYENNDSTRFVYDRHGNLIEQMIYRQSVAEGAELTVVEYEYDFETKTGISIVVAGLLGIGIVLAGGLGWLMYGRGRGG